MNNLKDYDIDISSPNFVKYIIDKNKLNPPKFEDLPSANDLCLVYLKENIHFGFNHEIKEKLAFTRNFVDMLKNEKLKKKFLNGKEFIIEYLD